MENKFPIAAAASLDSSHQEGGERVVGMTRDADMMQSRKLPDSYQHSDWYWKRDERLVSSVEHTFTLVMRAPLLRNAMIPNLVKEGRTDEHKNLPHFSFCFKRS